MDDFSTSIHSGPRGKTAFSAPLDVRYVGPLLGRYGFAAKDETGDSKTAVYACRTAGPSPHVVSLVAPVSVPVNDHTNLLLDHVGLLQGHVTRSTRRPPATSPRGPSVTWRRPPARATGT